MIRKAESQKRILFTLLWSEPQGYRGACYRNPGNTHSRVLWPCSPSVKRSPPPKKVLMQHREVSLEPPTQLIGQTIIVSGALGYCKSGHTEGVWIAVCNLASVSLWPEACRPGKTQEVCRASQQELRGGWVRRQGLTQTEQREKTQGVEPERSRVDTPFPFPSLPLFHFLMRWSRWGIGGRPE